MLKKALVSGLVLALMAAVLYASRLVKPQPGGRAEAPSGPVEAPRGPVGIIGRGLAPQAEPPSRETLAAEREKRLADLREYAGKGMFPHNHGHEGKRTPYFMDRHGRLCAVGYLIAKSLAGAAWDYDRFMGEFNIARTHSDVGIVYDDGPRPPKPAPIKDLLGFFNQVATANNHIRIADVNGGPILDWILRSGLTQEEAALIQPGYSYLACDACLPGSEQRAVTFGRPTEESGHIEAQDRERIREHLARVERKLREDTPASLALAHRRALGGELMLQRPAH